MNHSKYEWPFRVLLILLSVALLVSVTYNILAYRKSDEHALDHYSHQSYSRTLEGYEIGTMVILRENVRDLKRAIEKKTVDYSTVEHWYMSYVWLDKYQNSYSANMQQYAINGRKVLEPIVTNQDVFNLNAFPGFTYYHTVYAYFNIALSRLSGTEDVWELTDADVKKLKIIHELSASQLAIYERYISEEFDPTQLEEAIMLRLQLQKDLFQSMSGAVDMVSGILE